MIEIEKGQKWRYVGAGSQFYTPGRVYETLTDLLDDGTFQMTDDKREGILIPHHWTLRTFKDRFELATGPVRTKTITTKEIVSGDYGHVKVAPYDDERVVIHVSSTLSAAELRAAIATLTEIATALDEGATS